MGNKMIIANPHWQGGGKDCCYYGIKEVEEYYLKGESFVEIPASDKNSDLIIREKIIGLDIIRKQLMGGFSIVEEASPDKIFTVGGSCDGDIPYISYLNKRYNGDLAVLWVDAHGDINSAEESSSHLFYGMPIRALVGDFADTFGDIIKDTMSVGQFMNVGGRDLDPPEEVYFKKNNIPWVKVDNSDAILPKVSDAIKSLNKGHVYVHMDLDVLEPKEFAYYPLPAPCGLSVETVLKVLYMIRDNFNMVGYSLYEFSGAGKRLELMETLVRYGLSI